MATSLLALLDDIATVLDDVSVLTKVAAHKTVSVLGDDLALNAEQVQGVRAERELPVVWAVFKGSLVNKAILVPLALTISALAPWAIMPLLMVGGLYLCFEGAEKVAHAFHRGQEGDETHRAELKAALSDPKTDLAALERTKVKGAIRTDFILSAEIIVITLGTVESAGLLTQLLVLSGIALLMTAGVYGLVAAIVKLDDAGLHLSRSTREGLLGDAVRKTGHMMLRAAPRLMKGLSIAGTIAMFLVGGGIILHGLPFTHHFTDHLSEILHGMSAIGPVLSVTSSLAINALAGLLAGAVAFGIHTRIRRMLDAA
ncbi:DUF808 domain-containing protein [Imhoffiella purpurea]|uniref:Membrane protein, putative n=1 Tax=Imhoffiella purpurea TaxID=1249627 RepID=W9V263_9GAMM|nr:DUF808 domain-containing protein [Imhoffiella purpurea]EXJ13394.1 Membrane protein, putative [Imhoffiella purpurea]